MTRHEAREVAMQFLFSYEFHNGTEDHCTREALQAEDEYASFLINTVIDHIEAIDERIARYSLKWTLDQISKIDKTILRIAFCEMLYSKEKIDAPIIINEAIELAKAYSTDGSYRFINGVLNGYTKDNE